MFGSISNKTFDITLFIIYLTLVVTGWLVLYSTTYNPNTTNWLAEEHNKQAIYIFISLLIGFIILAIPNSTIFYTFSPFLYFITLLIAFITALIGKEVNGARAWLEFGGFKLQVSEFLKYTTALVFATYLSKIEHFSLKRENYNKLLITMLPIIGSMFVILLQKDTGTALVFTAFVVPLYREGFPGEFILYGILATILIFIALAIDSFPVMALLIFIIFVIWISFYEGKTGRYTALIFSLTFLFVYIINLAFLHKELNSIIIFSFITSSVLSFIYGYFFLKSSMKTLAILLSSIFLLIVVKYSAELYVKLPKHQKQRIDVVIGKKVDKRESAYNVIQSVTAIGSGGFWGKGFMKGAQENRLVPFRKTDFIFCTVAEEWGFVGSFFVIALYFALLWRIIYIAERQSSIFSRSYAYAIAGIIFFHIFANLGSEIKLIPVIGIPLPFFSYGGSSILNFSIMLFTLLRLDMDRTLQYEKIL